MSKFTVVITDHGFKDVRIERVVLENADAKLVLGQCQTTAEVKAAARDADALLVQWAPITAEVIAALEHCKIIVRYGIGVDNVDLAAAKALGIPVCNVPDYCVDEVADHTMAMALALARQLPAIDHRVRGGVWKITPDKSMSAFREMTFATAGLGRIGRAVLERARSFGFKLASYDSLVAQEEFARLNVRRVSLDELFQESDVLSLHLPLTAETRHFLNQTRLMHMKIGAIIINTARGALIDTEALADVLRMGPIASAALDVFETEPLPADHPLRKCPNALLTSHVAWYSQASVYHLQKLAAEEVVRGLRGEPLKNQVNK